MWGVVGMRGLIANHGLEMVRTWMQAFGHAIPKPTVLVSNMPTASDLARTWRRSAVAPGTERFYTRSGRRVTGRRGLHETAAYTPDFAAAVVNAWLRAPRPHQRDPPDVELYMHAWMQAGLLNEVVLGRFVYYFGPRRGGQRALATGPPPDGESHDEGGPELKALRDPYL